MGRSLPWATDPETEQRLDEVQQRLGVSRWVAWIYLTYGEPIVELGRKQSRGE